MNETIKNTLKGLVAEIDRLNKLEKEIDAEQFVNPDDCNIKELYELRNLRYSYQNKINTIIKGL